MEFQQFLDPSKSSVQTAAAAGSFLALLLSKEFNWLTAISLIVVGQVLAFWLAIPIADYCGWGMAWYPGVGLVIGLLGMSLTAAVVLVGKQFAADPLGTVRALLTLWRGK